MYDSRDTCMIHGTRVAASSWLPAAASATGAAVAAGNALRDRRQKRETWLRQKVQFGLTSSVAGKLALLALPQRVQLREGVGVETEAAPLLNQITQRQQVEGEFFVKQNRDGDGIGHAVM